MNARALGTLGSLDTVTSRCRVDIGYPTDSVLGLMYREMVRKGYRGTGEEHCPERGRRISGFGSSRRRNAAANYYENIETEWTATRAGQLSRRRMAVTGLCPP